MKAWTGGDFITINCKNQPNVSYRLNGCRILMQSNDCVSLPDNSGALHARLIPFKMTRSFQGREQIGLAELLAAECPAILLWALDGLRDLRAVGKFILPDTSVDLLRSLSTESAPLREFVDICCNVDARTAVQKGALYAVYTQFMRDHRPGEKVVTDAQFASDLRSTVPELSDAREGSPSATTCKGRTIKRTDYDKPDTRQNYWLGICPTEESASRPDLVLERVATGFVTTPRREPAEELESVPAIAS